jgi:molybdate transport system permease protein
MPSRRTALLILLSLPALSFIALPLLSLLARAELTRFTTSVCCGEVASALSLSLISAGVAAVVVLIIGTPAAYLLAYGRFRGKRVVDSLVDLPIVLPPAVAGVALLMAFGTSGVIGEHLQVLGIRVTYTTVAVVMAQVFVSCPFYIRQARIGFQNVPPPLIMASRTLGASQLRTFRRVTLPLAWHALVAGLIMAWARAIGEFGATIMFAGNLEGVTRTMPLAIYSLLLYENKPAAAIILSLTLVVVSFLVMVATRLLLGSETKAHDPTLVTA